MIKNESQQDSPPVNLLRELVMEIKLTNEQRLKQMEIRVKQLEAAVFKKESPHELVD